MQLEYSLEFMLFFSKSWFNSIKQLFSSKRKCKFHTKKHFHPSFALSFSFCKLPSHFILLSFFKFKNCFLKLKNIHTLAIIRSIIAGSVCYCIKICRFAGICLIAMFSQKVILYVSCFFHQVTILVQKCFTVFFDLTWTMFQKIKTFHLEK